jgi:N-acetyl-D-muramate 6-phosphate phosphatase
MPVDIAKVKAICFDVDGTLSNTDDQFVHRIDWLLSPFRFFAGRQKVHSIARRVVMLTEGPGNWIYGIADRIGMDGTIVAVGDRLYEMGIGEADDPFMLIDGVRGMLVMLQQHFPLSIISARGRKSTFKFLFQFELLSFFTAVATGQTCKHTKPYPDPIEWAADRMGVPASACLMIGDTVTDIQAGKRAGAQTVGVLCGFGEEKELKHAGADLIIDNTPDLIGLFSDF